MCRPFEPGTLSGCVVRKLQQSLATLNQDVVGSVRGEAVPW